MNDARVGNKLKKKIIKKKVTSLRKLSFSTKTTRSYMFASFDFNIQVYRKKNGGKDPDLTPYDTLRN